VCVLLLLAGNLGVLMDQPLHSLRYSVVWSSGAASCAAAHAEAYPTTEGQWSRGVVPEAVREIGQLRWVSHRCRASGLLPAHSTSIMRCMLSAIRSHV
jgi:hypothetical protein